jgi:DNA-binding CsgD family transcriptional regulator
VISILQGITKRILSPFTRFRKQFFQKVKEELDDHLQAINENTNEIQEVYESTCAMQLKYEKLYEMIQEIQMFMDSQAKRPAVEEQPAQLDLTHKEKQVFSLLYQSQEEGQSITHSEIAGRLNISEGMVMNYVSNLAKKGIPIKVQIDDKFKDIQAKHNVVGMNEAITQELIS